METKPLALQSIVQIALNLTFSAILCDECYVNRARMLMHKCQKCYQNNTGLDLGDDLDLDIGKIA